MTQNPNSVLKLYKSIIEHVISEVRDCFLDEGVDEQVLQELKQIWENKLTSSKAVEIEVEREPHPPVLLQHKPTKVINPIVQTNSQVIKKPGTYPVNQTIMNQQMQHTQVVHQQQQQPNQIQQQQQQQQTQAQAQQPPQQTQSVPQTIQQLALDPNRQVPLQITLPPQAGSYETQPRVLTIQVPASALAGNALQSILTGPVISATMALPQNLASSLLQQHVNAALAGQASSTAGVQVIQQPQMQAQQQAQSAATQQSQQGFGGIRQLDGGLDTSDDDDDEADDDDDDDDDADEDKDEDENEEENDGGQEEEPLNSEDDVSDEDPQDLFDTDNVVVCQYDKITRTRNKWKFYLKDGIMNLGGKDYVFQKANGDAEW